MLEKPTRGAIIFRGHDIQTLKKDELKTYRRGVQAVFQDPFSSLNPRIRVGDIIAEPVVVNESLPKAQMRERVQELLRLVGLNPSSSNLFPHEFSGGQRQRIAIARALVNRPSILLADEPTGALDTATGVEIMALFERLYQQGNTIVLVTHEHDIAMHAHRVVWIRDGKVAKDEKVQK
jgi:ABC-type microcin C transport system duplicated ATPase subunit YejF